jgi:cryptochrome
MAVAIHWFRKGLRVHDNPALVEACRQSSIVYPVFVLDPHFANPEIVGANRYQFLLESLEDLNQNLIKIGLRLFLLKGKPTDVFPVVFSRWGINTLTYEYDHEPYARDRDITVQQVASSMNVAVSVHSSHTIHPIEAYTGKFASTYGNFTSLFFSLPPPPPPLDPPQMVRNCLFLLLRQLIYFR